SRSNPDDDEGTTPRVGRVTILGVDERFWPAGKCPVSTEFWQPATKRAHEGVVLSEALAERLKVNVGDRVTLHLPKATAAPAESQFGQRDMMPIALRVAAVLAGGSPGGRFSLNASTDPPRNAYVPLSVLQSGLTTENIVLKERANALFTR